MIWGSIWTAQPHERENNRTHQLHIGSSSEEALNLCHRMALDPNSAFWSGLFRLQSSRDSVE